MVFSEPQTYVGRYHESHLDDEIIVNMESKWEH
jgi:hypothetical protein